MTYKTCENCGKKLETKEEINEGLCEECLEDEMDDLASAILNTEEIFPSHSDF